MSNLSEPDLPPALRASVDARYRNFAGPGWWPILERMHERLLPIDSDYRLTQVKEKFGILSVYLDEERYLDRPHLVAQIEAVIDAAVQESAVTCERCGEPGRLRNDENWLSQRQYVLTLCDDCAPVALEEWRNGVRAFIAEFIVAEDE